MKMLPFCWTVRYPYRNENQRKGAFLYAKRSWEPPIRIYRSFHAYLIWNTEKGGSVMLCTMRDLEAKDVAIWRWIRVAERLRRYWFWKVWADSGRVGEKHSGYRGKMYAVSVRMRFWWRCSARYRTARGAGADSSLAESRRSVVGEGAYDRENTAMRACKITGRIQRRNVNSL